jgi:hypothetical protein
MSIVSDYEAKTHQYDFPVQRGEEGKRVEFAAE